MKYDKETKLKVICDSAIHNDPIAGHAILMVKPSETYGNSYEFYIDGAWTDDGWSSGYVESHNNFKPVGNNWRERIEE